MKRALEELLDCSISQLGESSVFALALVGHCEGVDHHCVEIEVETSLAVLFEPANEDTLDLIPRHAHHLEPPGQSIDLAGLDVRLLLNRAVVVVIGVALLRLSPSDPLLAPLVAEIVKEVVSVVEMTQEKPTLDLSTELLILRAIHLKDALGCVDFPRAGPRCNLLPATGRIDLLHHRLEKKIDEVRELLFGPTKKLGDTRKREVDRAVLRTHDRLCTNMSRRLHSVQLDSVDARWVLKEETLVDESVELRQGVVLQVVDEQELEALCRVLNECQLASDLFNGCAADCCVFHFDLLVRALIFRTERAL